MCLLAGSLTRKVTSKALTPCWHAVLTIQSASATAEGDGASAAGASGMLDTVQHQPGSGYVTHPAVTDASLHLGASLAALPKQGDGQPDAALVRVPSSLGAFWTVRGATVGDCWAAAGDLSAQAANAALSSYWLLSGTGSAGRATLSGLLAKPLKAAAALGSKAASTQAAPDSSMLYSMQWRAVAPALGGTGGRMHARLYWQYVGQHHSPEPAEHVHLCATGMSAGAVALQASAVTLALMQRLLTGQGSTPAGLRVCGMNSTAEGIAGSSMRQSLQHMVALAGASGLLRSAAQEYPAMTWQTWSSTSQLSLHGSSAAVRPPDLDAFGLQHSESTHYRPQMLPAAADTPTDTAAALTGSVAITGGLGSIGMLAGLWAAEQGGPVHLLGRTGHAQRGALPLLARAPLAVMMRCDAGSCEEAVQLRSLGSGGPLRQIWHAGGALQDATLPKQSLALLRVVAAPKLDGIMRLCAVLGHGTPLDGVALFSSTAALLGPPGQGNYAAANAQLNVWSLATQSAGGWYAECVAAVEDHRRPFTDAYYAGRFLACSQRLQTPSQSSSY